MVAVLASVPGMIIPLWLLPLPPPINMVSSRFKMTEAVFLLSVPVVPAVPTVVTADTVTPVSTARLEEGYGVDTVFCDSVLRPTLLRLLFVLPLLASLFTPP